MVYGVEVRRYGNGGTAECFVPRLIGATAAAQAEKRSQTSLDEKPQNTEPDVLTAAERLRFLAEEIGVPVRSTPASLRLTDSLGSVVLLYPTYRTVEFPLDLLYRTGRQGEISQVLETLQQITGTTKKVSTKSPNVGVRDALEHWGTPSPTSSGHWCASEPRTHRTRPANDLLAPNRGPIRSCRDWRAKR